MVTTDAQQNANLTLAAKSPDMLVAIESIIKAYKAYDGGLSEEADLFDAITNAEALGWDPQGLYAATVTGVSYEQWRDEMLSPEALMGHRVLPFSPLMEDPVTRRKYLDGLLQQIAPEIFKQFDQREVAREVVDTFQLRPSLLPPEEAVEEAPPAEGAPAGGVPPEMMAALGGQGPAPGAPAAPSPSPDAAQLPIPPEAQARISHLPPEVQAKVMQMAQGEAMRRIQGGDSAPPLPPPDLNG